MKHVLIPVDGSAKGASSAEALVNLFPPEDAAVTLLLVREDVDSTSSVLLDRMAKESMPLLDEVARLIPQYAVEKVVDFGIPGHVILRYAKERAVDVILVARRSHSALTNLMGSVATHLVKHAPCPVVVVPVDVDER